ncbi:aminotransferase class V-fold PLP-dependent enzyme [Saprospiraceae bacterium]|nr:aminotransferase class V-fold PLP-dependent enzyme [Saprospiraceae bacterium]
MKIYTEQAGAGILSEATLSAIFDYYKLENKVGGYEAQKKSFDLINSFYENTKQLINAESVIQIAYTDSASRGWNLILQGLPLHNYDKIITLSTEYVTNITTLKELTKDKPQELIIIQCQANGDFNLSELEDHLKGSKCIVALSHCVAHGSVDYPIIKIGQLCKQYDSYYILDAAQSIGQIPIDVQKIGCDVLTANGRKWLSGPRGTGFLYVKDSSKINHTHIDASSTLIDENSKEPITKESARKFELWERSFADMIGLSVAIRSYIEKDVYQVHQKSKIIATQIRKSIDSNTKLNLIGQADSESCIIGFYPTLISDCDKIAEHFKNNKVSISLLENWMYPLHFNTPTRIFRLALPHSVDTPSVDRVIDIINKI